MKYLDKRMVFIPPQPLSKAPKNWADAEFCDHKGYKQTYVHGRWECSHCERVVE